jgi:hypothetical protein
MTGLIIAAGLGYLLLDKYLPLLLANKARPSRSLFGWRMRTDP